MVKTYVQSTPILTEDQEVPPRIVAGRAVLRERKPGEDDPTLGKRAGGLSKQQLNAVKQGGGISLDSAVTAARRFGWSLDDLFGLTGRGRPPSAKEQAFDEIAAIVLRVLRGFDDGLSDDAGDELDDLAGGG